MHNAGRCLSRENCASTRDTDGTVVGRDTGPCAQGFGVCCVHIIAITNGIRCPPLPGHDPPTGDMCPDLNRRQLSTIEVQEKLVYLQNRNFPRYDENDEDVILTLVPRDEDVVQYRLDFITFEEMSPYKI